MVGAVVAVLLICGGGAALTGWIWTGAMVDTTGKVEFVAPLAVPPLAESRIDEQGRRVFDLRAQAGGRDFGQGGRTRTWGFNGDYLGPTLRAKRGEQVVVNVANALDEPTSVHWHGMHLPAAMDGGPHQEVRPGATWAPTWTINQPAATLWYHPHPHGQTEKHVYRGLAGLFLLDDDQASGLALPKRYGVDDIPVIVQDRNFDRSGQFDSRAGLGGAGILGETLLVNGTVGPYLDVTTERVRLRLLNGSTARTYDFGFADGRTVTLVGTDGGLLPAPQAHQRVRLSPGERAEIVVAIRPGERVVLRSFPPDLGIGSPFRRLGGGEDTFDVLQLRAAERLDRSAEVPETLVPLDRIDPATSVTTRQFRLLGRNINGQKMDMGRIDATITRDTTEIWEVTNADGSPHNFHVHDVQFQVLTVAGRQPPPELRGWKDTIFLAPHTTMRIIMRFTDHADPNVPYMFHCHLLYHEDQGMMGQFVVVEPGQQAGRVAGGAGGDHHHHHR